jgi:tryptophan synthase alpha chain
MTLLDEKFSQLKNEQRRALMPYVPLGFPSLDVSRDLIRAVADAGADVIELGVPFSDPLADGPVIQHATQVALQNGMTLAKCLEMAQAARDAGVTIPLVLMGYYNPILRFGIEKLTRAARDAGVDGLIVPDLPPEEAGAISAASRAEDLDLIFLAAPTSTAARLELIGRETRGFLYLVSVTGVTGARATVSSDLGAFVARARAVTSKPVCVGFGISDGKAARAVAQIADGVIVGSALVSKIGEQGTAVDAARKFVGELRSAMDG